PLQTAGRHGLERVRPHPPPAPGQPAPARQRPHRQRYRLRTGLLDPVAFWRTVPPPLRHDAGGVPARRPRAAGGFAGDTRRLSSLTPTRATATHHLHEATSWRCPKTI